jgi:rod shape-determining protein MreD
VPLLAGVALVQSVLLSQVTLWGARPDLMVLVVVGWSVVRDVEEGVVWAFIGGLMVDLFSGGPLGSTMMALLAVAFLTGQPWGRGIGSPVVRLWLLAFAAVMAYHLILLAILAWTGVGIDWTRSLLRVAAPSALLNAMLAPFVQRPLSWLERQVRRETFTR